METLSKTDTYIFRALKILLGAGLLTPLLMSASFIFPYTLPKAFAFRLLVELAAIGYIYLVLKYPKMFCSFLFFSVIPAKAGIQDSRSRIKCGMTIGVAILAFLVVNLFSAIFSSDFYTSWWGSLERMGGVWSLMYFIAWFFMLVSVFRIDAAKINTPPFFPPKAGPPLAEKGEGGFKKQNFSRQLIQISVAISGLIALLAIGQHFFSLGDLLPQVDRVYATLGNAGVLGSYLIFNIFLTGYLAISKSPSTRPAVAELAQGIKKILPERSEAKSKAIRISYWLLLIINCMALALTGTRGAWLGLLVGVIVFLVLNFFVPPFLKGGEEPARHRYAQALAGGGFKGFKKLSLFSLIAIVIVVGLFFSFRSFSFIKNNPTLSRLTSISLGEATIQSRLLLWQGAWRAWQEKPVLGWGPESFETATAPYLSPKLANFESYGTDRAHNFIFDYGVATGWLGLMGYLVMIGAAGWLLIKNLLPERSEAKSKANMVMDPSTRAADAALAQGIGSNYYFSVFFIPLLTAYLVQNLFIFDSFVSYLMLFFILAIIDSNCQNNPSFITPTSSVIPARFDEANARRAKVVDPDARGAGIQDYGFRVTRLAEDGESRREPGMTTSLGIIKKLIFIFFVFFIFYSLFSFNLKPFLAANYANQILSLPASEAEQAGPLLEDVIALKTFALPEVAYQVSLDYIDKIGQNPALAQNEKFYDITSLALNELIVRFPGRVKNYIALSWLDLYFSGFNSQRVEEAISLGNKAKEMSPNKKDAYLLLVAGYSLSDQSQKAQETVDQAIAIDAKMGEEVGSYLEKLK